MKYWHTVLYSVQWWIYQTVGQTMATIRLTHCVFCFFRRRLWCSSQSELIVNASHYNAELVWRGHASNYIQAHGLLEKDVWQLAVACGCTVLQWNLGYYSTYTGSH